MIDVEEWRGYEPQCGEFLRPTSVRKISKNMKNDGIISTFVAENAYQNALPLVG